MHTTLIDVCKESDWQCVVRPPLSSRPGGVESQSQLRTLPRNLSRRATVYNRLLIVPNSPVQYVRLTANHHVAGVLSSPRFCIKLDKPMRLKNLQMLGTLGLKVILYGGLSLFMFILAYTTYLHGGGFRSWQSILVIVTMLSLFVMLARIGIQSFSETLAGRSYS